MQKKESKVHYLFSNMALFTVSNFVSKLLVFLLVPFYTNVLTEAEYGVADVMQVSLLLLVPLLSVNAGEAALRYGIENPDKRVSILRSGLRRVFFSAGIVLVACAAALFLPLSQELKIYISLFAVLFAFNAIYEFMLLYTQGCEQVKIMITGSVSCTAFIIGCNLFFLLVLRLGLYGYIYSQMAAYALSSLIMFGLIVRQWRQKNPSPCHVEEDLALRSEMLDYGKGMLLYSTSSWINNAIDRYFILFMMGAASNGIYGVAYKIPAILMVFQRIFAQSFQMSATKSYREYDAARFFSRLYGLYNAVMVSGCSVILLILHPLAHFMFNKGFIAARIYVPPLLISIIFGALNGFLGSICLAYKDGKSMGQATGIGAVLNIGLNFIGIRLFGIMGAAVATMLSYFTMFAVAFFKTGKHVKLKVNFLKDLGAYLLLLAEAVIAIREVPMYYLYNAAITALLLVTYGREIMTVAKDYLKKIKK